MMKHTKLYWSKLDNSAKVYPALTSDKYTYVFRVSATMTETVDKDKLYIAILAAKKRFPSFYVKLKRGLFWYYFEENLLDPVLEVEKPFVCQRMDDLYTNRYLFRFLYYNKRISLEVNHCLTDGSGAISFLNSIIYKYLELVGKTMISDDSIMLMDHPLNIDEIEDSYQVHDSHQGLNPPKIPKAYVYKTKKFKKYGNGVINSFIDSNDLIGLAKENNASLTQFIVALLTYAVIVNGNKKKLTKLPVNVCIPVNLRSIFYSKTLHNFSLYFHTSYQYKDKLDFDNILDKIKKDFTKEYNLEKIQRKLDTICAIQKKIYFKLIPLPIKYILFNLGYIIFGRKPTTVTMSNFGVVKIPKSMEDYIESFSFYMGSNEKHAIAVNTYQGTTSIVFSRGSIDTKIEKTFFRYLTEKGIKVRVTSNYWENK